MRILLSAIAATTITAHTNTNADSPLLTAGSLPLPSLIPIGLPGGLDPNQVEFAGPGGTDASPLTPGLPHLTENLSSKTAPTLDAADPEKSEAPELPGSSSLIELPGKNPHHLYWLPTGDELNGLEAETVAITQANEKKKEINEVQQIKEEMHKEKEEEKEQESEEIQLQKEDPLEKYAPVHGLRPFGWKPQLEDVQTTDPYKLNADAFETRLIEMKTHLRSTRNKVQVKATTTASAQPGLEDGWSMMQASTPFDDKDASYVMPAMKPNSDELDLSALKDGSEKGVENNKDDIDNIEKDADSNEAKAAISVVKDIANGFDFDVSGIPGR